MYMKISNNKTRKCLICKQEYTRPPALSRKDNKTLICPDCGTKEALQDFLSYTNKEIKNNGKNKSISNKTK